MVQRFSDVIALWGSPDELAVAVGAKVETVRKWRQRDRIPPEWWQRIIHAANARGNPLTADEMAAMNIPRKTKMMMNLVLRLRVIRILL